MSNQDNLEMKYLKSIAKQFPTIAEASTEIINLQSILNLPKGTEHFLTDIHGEYEQFRHVLKNGSGSVRRKIEDEFGNTLSQKDIKTLATLIYYPEEKLKLIVSKDDNLEDCYKTMLYQLIRITRRVSSKYTRSKVRKAIPKDFVYIIEELLHEKEEVLDKEAYYNEIIQTMIRIGRAKEFIVILCDLIQRLVIDHLHIVGDIYDRGPGAAKIMDTLLNYHSVDIQWGNHDILWIGAASGQLACIANVIRLSIRYDNLDTLEEDYGINLIPLVTFALDGYKDDPCTCFCVKYREQPDNEKKIELDRKMQKAISIIQFKLEGQIIKRNPEFNMDKRLLMDKIDYKKGTILIDNHNYPLNDTYFPTINPDNPYELSKEEQRIMLQIQSAFLNCEKLQKHMKFLMTNGSMYLVYNSNLLYHGCIPFHEDGSFRKVKIRGKEYSGKGLYDALDGYARRGYYDTSDAKDEKEKQFGQEILWYIWSNEDSPVYGKKKMATFERYFLTDKTVQVEKKDYYYTLIEQEEIVNKILAEFGLCNEEAHIINGHMPVQLKNGETPVKCNGKLLMIDGGFAKAYQKLTGIAGYTLIYNSYGLRLVSHEPFESTEACIRKESDIHSETVVVQNVNRRHLVSHTEIGKNIKETIKDLECLLRAYREGSIR